MTELNSESMPDATASTEANPSRQNEAKAPAKKPSGAKTQASSATKSKASAKSSSASKKSAKPASKRPAKATSKSADSGTKASKSSQTKKANSSVKPSAAPQTNPDDVFRSISTLVQADSKGASNAISNAHSDARAAQSSSDRAPQPVDSAKAADPSSVLEGKNAAVTPSPQEERQTAASSLADGEPKTPDAAPSDEQPSRKSGASAIRYGENLALAAGGNSAEAPESAKFAEAAEAPEAAKASEALGSAAPSEESGRADAASDEPHHEVERLEGRRIVIRRERVELEGSAPIEALAQYLPEVDDESGALRPGNDEAVAEHLALDARKAAERESILEMREAADERRRQAVEEALAAHVAKAGKKGRSFSPEALEAERLRISAKLKKAEAKAIKREILRQRFIAEATLEENDLPWYFAGPEAVNRHVASIISSSPSEGATPDGAYREREALRLSLQEARSNLTKDLARLEKLLSDQHQDLPEDERAALAYVHAKKEEALKHVETLCSAFEADERHEARHLSRFLVGAHGYQAQNPKKPFLEQHLRFQNLRSILGLCRPCADAMDGAFHGAGAPLLNSQADAAEQQRKSDDERSHESSIDGTIEGVKEGQNIAGDESHNEPRDGCRDESHVESRSEKHERGCNEDKESEELEQAARSGNAPQGHTGDRARPASPSPLVGAAGVARKLAASGAVLFACAAACAYLLAPPAPAVQFAVVDTEALQTRMAMMRIAAAKPGEPEDKRLSNLNIEALNEAIRQAADETGAVVLDRRALLAAPRRLAEAEPDSFAASLRRIPQRISEKLGFAQPAPAQQGEAEAALDLTAAVAASLGIEAVDPKALEAAFRANWLEGSEAP